MSVDVLVTGIGIVSPAGIGWKQTWSALLADGRAVRHLAGGSHPELARHPVAADVPVGRNSPEHRPATTPMHEGGYCGATIDGFQPPAATSSLSRTTQLAVAATAEALDSANIADTRVRAKVRVSIGTSKPLADLLAPAPDGSQAAGNLLVAPPCNIFDILPDAPARAVRKHFGLAAHHASVSACATGLHAIIRGAQMIRDGEAELVIAGSADSSLSPLWLAAYRNMGVLADEHRQCGPAWACRPFDRTRSGFVVGEGAGMLVLESPDSATRRGVRAWARLAAWAAGSDPRGLTQLSQADSPLAEVIQKSLSGAGLGPQDVACICAHGTATIANDRAEIAGFRRVFGQHLTSLPVVSAKGALGHLMGAAGAVETALAVLARFHDKSPGTATLIEPDPQFADLRLPTTSFDLAAGAILKTSLGFGGHLAAIVVE